MNEIITVGGVKYTAIYVETGLNTISFAVSGVTADEAHATFKNTKFLTVGNGEEIYGEYPDVEFESVTINAEGEIIVTMHIPTKIERQIRELQESNAQLQTSQGEQDEVLAEMLYGGGEE